jgi:hypothetical protein
MSERDRAPCDGRRAGGWLPKAPQEKGCLPVRRVFSLDMPKLAAGVARSRVRDFRPVAPFVFARAWAEGRKKKVREHCVIG